MLGFVGQEKKMWNSRNPLSRGLECVLDHCAQNWDLDGFADTASHAALPVQFLLFLAVAGGDCNDGDRPVGLQDGVFLASTNGLGGLHTSQDGHVNVHQDQIDGLMGQLFERLYTRSHFMSQDHLVLEVGLEYFGEKVEVDRVVVDDHDSQF